MLKKYLVCWDGGMGSGEWFWIEANSADEINSALPEEFVVFESFPNWWEKSGMDKVDIPTHQLGKPLVRNSRRCLMNTKSHEPGVKSNLEQYLLESK